MRELQIEKWCVIHYNGADAIVTIDNDDPNKFHWSGGFTWATFDGADSYIVKEYGFFREGDDEIDNLFLDFYKNYNVPASYISQTAGWLSPNGEFFPCSYYQHDSFASSLAAIFHDSLDGTQRLEKEGWLRIYDRGEVGRKGDRKVTKKQLETIQDILNSPKNPSGNFDKSLKNWFEIFLREYDE